MRHISLILLLTAISFAGFSQTSDAIVGEWINSSGEAHIEIFKKSNKFFGKIVSLKEPKDDKGNIKTDFKNPSENLRKRPILGLELLNNFVYDNGKWVDGTIYDPKTGKTYSCNLSIKSNGDLNVRGYVGISLIGRSDTWKRAK